MMIYTYSSEKNLKLMEERDIGFDEVIAAIENGQVLDILENHQREKYRNQRVFVISVKDYVYLVPYVEDDEGNVFLKTIIPSRKAKKQYGG